MLTIPFAPVSFSFFAESFPPVILFAQAYGLIHIYLRPGSHFALAFCVSFLPRIQHSIDANTEDKLKSHVCVHRHWAPYSFNTAHIDRQYETTTAFSTALSESVRERRERKKTVAFYIWNIFIVCFHRMCACVCTCVDSYNPWCCSAYSVGTKKVSTHKKEAK